MTLLQQLQQEIAAKGIIRKKQLIDAILSLISEQEATRLSDKEAAEKDYPLKSEEEYYNGPYSLEPYYDYRDGIWALQTAYLAGCQHVRQQIQPITCGEQIITQEVFNRIYTHYTDLCTQLDVDDFWQNQYIMADAERNELKAWKESAMHHQTSYTPSQVQALLKEQRELCIKGVKADLKITDRKEAAKVVRSTPLVKIEIQNYSTASPQPQQ